MFFVSNRPFSFWNKFVNYISVKTVTSIFGKLPGGIKGPGMKGPGRGSSENGGSGGKGGRGRWGGGKWLDVQFSSI